MILLVAAVVVALCSAVQGSVGFGLNLLAVPVLLLLDARLVPGPALVAGLLLSLLMTGREFGAMDPRMSWAVLGLLPGTALGLVLLANVAEDDLGVPLGALVLVGVTLSAVRWSPQPTTRNLLRAGFASGFLATAASIGGPPMALVYTRQSGARLRSTLAGFFIAAAVVSLVALTLVGRFGGADLGRSVALLPGVVVGFLASGPLRPYVDRGRSRPLVLGLSAVASVVAIVQGVVG